ncbi:MAG: hypothetical protein ACI4I7_06070 [Oscillospiraceae bacterium]
MNEILQGFLEEEIVGAVYEDLWNFINSDSIVRGTFECSRHAVMKLSASTFIIYRQFIVNDNLKCQDAVLVGKNYFLKKINSMAYKRRLPNIQNILD